MKKKLGNCHWNVCCFFICPVMAFFCFSHIFFVSLFFALFVIAWTHIIIYKNVYLTVESMEFIHIYMHEMWSWTHIFESQSFFFDFIVSKQYGCFFYSFAHYSFILSSAYKETIKEKNSFLLNSNHSHTYNSIFIELFFWRIFACCSTHLKAYKFFFSWIRIVVF